MGPERIENILSSHFSSLREGWEIVGICQELSRLAEKKKTRKNGQEINQRLVNILGSSG